MPASWHWTAFPHIFDQVEQVSLQYTDTSGTTQTQTLASGIDYQAFGAVNALTWGNGLSLNRSFDQDGRLRQQQVSSAIQSLNFNYDPVGNILGITDLTESAKNMDRHSKRESQSQRSSMLLN